MKEKKVILARFIKPPPKGLALYAQDLDAEDTVVQLFKACQNFQGVIYAKGWAYLYQNFGLAGLYKIDQGIGWFSAENKQEWLKSLLDWALISGFNFQTGHVGVYDKKKDLFTTDDGRLEMIDHAYFAKSL